MNPLPIRLSQPVQRKIALERAIELLGRKHCLHPQFERRNLRDGLLTEWRSQRVMERGGR